MSQGERSLLVVPVLGGVAVAMNIDPTTLLITLFTVVIGPFALDLVI